MNPRVAQWDDGNFVNGDGWDSSCMIESGYIWILDSSLNNKSLWIKAWGNGVIDTSYNENWDDLNTRPGDGWSSDCRIESGFKWDDPIPNVPSYCYPNWGDGVKDISPNFEEWDDGNNFDYDGCSKDCKTEFNYNWTYDSNKKADVCKTVYDPPEILNSTFNSKSNQITVNFNQTMLNQTVSLTDLTIDISGPNSPHKISWSSQFINSSYQMSFTSTPALVGGIGEVITVQLINVGRFKSIKKIPIKSFAELKFNVMSFEPNQSTQAAGSGASYTFIVTGIISIIIGVLTGGSIELMWSLANTLQILFFFGMLNLYYSADLLTMYSFMKYSNFDNPASDYLSSKTTVVFKFIQNPVSDSFSNLGFESTEIISNCLDKLFMILQMLVILAGLFVLYILVRNKTNKFANFIKQKDINLRYEGITRFFVELILVISVANFINLVNGNFGNVFEIISYLFSIILLIMTFALIIYKIII